MASALLAKDQIFLFGNSAPQVWSAATKSCARVIDVDIRFLKAAIRIQASVLMIARPISESDCERSYGVPVGYVGDAEIFQDHAGASLLQRLTPG